MSVVIVTGSGGLIGSECVRQFAERGHAVIGIENDMRAHFFGEDASTKWVTDDLRDRYPSFESIHVDVRDYEQIERIFAEHSTDVDLVIHTAAQPSHDWAASNPQVDFGINANGTLNLLESTRSHASEATFIFTSTNKVYGDTPNRLPLIERETRLELPEDHPYYHGIDKTMSIDSSLHSLFGVSKAAADLMVQEYGRYFGLRTACFRCGCLTGPSHSPAQLHGFLSYLMRCTVTGESYTVFGYGGKQVRDNIHSKDVVSTFVELHKAPRVGEVYNLGGGRQVNCSMLEAISLCEEIAGRKLNWRYDPSNRVGDHRWWISSNRKFMEHYPSWRIKYDLHAILQEIYENNVDRWTSPG